MAARLDPRRTAIRDDLIDNRLPIDGGERRRVEPVVRVVSVPVAALRAGPELAARRTSEMLFGERVDVFEIDPAASTAWVQRQVDGYVGYVDAVALAEPADVPATHRVRALEAFVFAEPDIKSMVLAAVPLNARLTAVHDPFTSNAFQGVSFRGGVGYLHARQVAPIDALERDFVAIAERLVDTPYLWGGITRRGLDCSGLVQCALHAHGQPCPRDSDMQFSELGRPLFGPDVVEGLLERPDDADIEGFERGDLVFWSGHVGIMTDGIMMVHATAHYMSVVIEPFATAARRIAKSGGTFLGARRLEATGAHAV
ncbi:MAG: NlpC/P60 family protein [Hyphomicrobiaceae bacterium]